MPQEKKPPKKAPDGFGSIMGTKRGSDRPDEPTGDDALYREESTLIEKEDGDDIVLVSYSAYQGGPLHRDDGPAVQYGDDGQKEWYQHGERHREGAPAIEGAEGKYWYRRGVLHREDGPAIEGKDGLRQWYIHGELHRTDGPASIAPNGDQEWFLDGELRRDDGPVIERHDGYKEWHVNGQVHREDGPAVEYPDGSVEWWRDNHYYREDGPAIEWANGTRVWYLNQEVHREDGPAIIWPLHQGVCNIWVRHGKLHREDGPAIEQPYWLHDDDQYDQEPEYHNYDANGSPIQHIPDMWLNNTDNDVDSANLLELESRAQEEWWVNGELHREDGPARVWSGDSDDSEWYHHGVKIDPPQVP
jgi:hypothetical protein